MSPDPAEPRTPRRRRNLALVLAFGVLAACTGERPTLEPAAPPTTVAATTTTAPPDDAPLSPFNMLGYIATPTGAPVVHRAPDAASPTFDIPATTSHGAPTTFAVVGDPGPAPTGWLRVVLPIRPNEATGYVEASTVALTHTDMRAFVDLEARTLTVRTGDQVTFEVPVAIGTEANPTPAGAAFVTELLETPQPSGAYGPYAFGLSMHSDTITEFGDGGDGQVGIHGTNKPKLIGERVSAGCVRVENDDIERLVDLQVPLGMPVFINA